MALFGGRQGKQQQHQQQQQQQTTNRNVRLGWGRPNTASARNREEREALISSSTGADDFDDSDAISLLSNIADRDSRRGGSASAAAARRRARARSRAQGRTCGTFWFDVEDWGRSMSCGLLGRRQGSNEDGESGRQRAASIGSVMSRGARRAHASSSTAPIAATSRHSRSYSDASTDSAGSLAGSGFAENIDADAGMLDDRDIARFGRASQASPVQNETETTTAAAVSSEAEARARAEAEAAERQKALEAEAARLQAEADAETQRQQEEEARLAAQEESAIAKARRKAQRKAAKAGLLQLQQETQAAQRWHTEAEAEAAAGGFAFTDADDDASYHHHAHQHYDYHDAEQEMQGGEYDQYGDAEEAQADGYYAGTVEERGPGGVVHHHHYYHSAPPPADEEEEFVYPGATIHSHTADAFGEAQPREEVDAATTADTPVSEDEADIAGLSFGRKKSRGRHEGGSAGSRSGSGLRPAHATGGSSSGGSASALHVAPTSASSSSGSRSAYRDRPRRTHERTPSKSSNSSSGLFSLQSSNALHPGAPPSTAATSVTSPPPLPNLYESDSIYASGSGAAKRHGEGLDAEQAQFGKPDVDASEFGVITAGSHKGGAGRVKKSYRDKRQQQQQQQQGEEEGKQEGAFEGFPGI